MPAATPERPEPPPRPAVGAGPAGDAGMGSPAAAVVREVGELLQPLSSIIKKRGSSSKPDPALEVALDENRRLQRVVEETMLKNQQLKDMVAKLGDEIDRLHQQRAAANKQTVA